jgi:hypothetical protein
MIFSRVKRRFSRKLIDFVTVFYLACTGCFGPLGSHRDICMQLFSWAGCFPQYILGQLSRDFEFGMDHGNAVLHMQDMAGNSRRFGIQDLPEWELQQKTSMSS